jgi:hypothetical protein
VNLNSDTIPKLTNDELETELDKQIELSKSDGDWGLVLALEEEAAKRGLEPLLNRRSKAHNATNLAIREALDTATEEAELDDNWEVVAALEQLLERRGYTVER